MGARRCTSRSSKGVKNEGASITVQLLEARCYIPPSLKVKVMLNTKQKLARDVLPWSLLPPDYLVRTLEAVPAEDWCRTWAACRTIMLRRTSKSVKQEVDKMRLPAVVHLCELWIEEGRGFQKSCRLQKLQIVMKELPLMTAWCRITTVKLYDLCDSKFAGQIVRNNFVRVLQRVVRQSAGTLTWLGLAHNDLDNDGTNIVARVLGECRALTTLHLQYNDMGWHGARNLARVLPVCTALTELNLAVNQIGPGGAERLAGVLAQCTALAHLDLGFNRIGDSGAESIAAVLGKCPALKFLDVQENDIGPVGNRRLASFSTGTLQIQLRDLYHAEEDEEEAEEEDTSDVDREEEDEEEAEEEPHSD